MASGTTILGRSGGVTLCSYDLTALRCVNQEVRSTLCGGLGGRDAQGAGQTVELGAVHCLSYGDLATSSTRHRIPINPSEDQEEAGCLGGREPWDVGGGDPAHVSAIPHRHLRNRVVGNVHRDELRWTVQIRVHTGCGREACLGVFGAHHLHHPLPSLGAQLRRLYHACLSLVP